MTKSHQAIIAKTWRDARRVAWLHHRAMRRAARTYLLMEVLAGVLLLFALYLLVPILRSAGGAQANGVAYGWPWSAPGTVVFTLPWWVPFVVLVLASWFTARTRRREFAIVRVSAMVYEQTVRRLPWRSDDEAVLRRLENMKSSTAMATRWVITAVADGLRVMGGTTLLLFMAPAVVPIALLVSMSALLVYVQVATRRVASETMDSVKVPKEDRVEAHIRLRLRLSDAMQAYTIVAPFTVLAMLVLDRIGIGPGLDVVDLLVVVAIVSVVARSLGSILQAAIRLYERPSIQVDVFERLIAGDLDEIRSIVRDSNPQRRDRSELDEEDARE